MKALILSADIFEDSELLYPLYRLQEAGYDVEIASLVRGVISGKRGYEVTAVRSFAEVDPEGYDVLVLPGGKAPAAIRGDAHAQAIARAFMSTATAGGGHLPRPATPHQRRARGRTPRHLLPERGR